MCSDTLAGLWSIADEGKFRVRVLLVTWNSSPFKTAVPTRLEHELTRALRSMIQMLPKN